RLPWLSCRLRIAEQMVEKLAFHGTKQAFLGRAEARLSSGTLVFPHAVKSQQLLKVHAGKLRATIDRNRCWQTPIAFDTQTKDREARTITGWIEGQVKSSNASRMRENEERQPAFSQRLACPGIAQDQV